MDERFPHLSRAPITEALIDLRVELGREVSIANLQELHSQIAEDYPNTKPRMRVEGRFEFRSELPADVELSPPEPDGIFFISQDHLNVMQARLDGFTFSRLKPYQRWEDLRDEARRLWRFYSDIVQPVTVTRVAVRFINRIEFPLPVRDSSDYLTALPPIPPRLPQVMVSFLSRVVVEDASSQALAVITQALEDTRQPKSITVLLDIDTFREGRFDPSSDETWKIFENLRNLKNRIFFESITEKCVEMHK